VLLWDVLFRGQLGVSLTFIEELYSRNLGNLFVSPLRYYELIAGQLVMSILRTLIGVGGACFFAWLLFHYSIFSYGLPLVAFFANLMMFGWAIGLAVSGMVLRWGLGAEELAWAAIFLFAPVSGVYYPIDVLPVPLQYVAWLGHAVQGDLGRSFQNKQKVSDAIIERLPATFELGAAALLISITFALVIGILSAVKRNSIVDLLSTSITLLGVSFPSFFLGIVLILMFAYVIPGRIFPPGGNLS